MRRGFTLIELLVGMGVMGLLMLGTLTVFSQSMQGFYRTKTDIELSTDSSQAIQRVADTLRSAYNMQITNNGKTVVYTMPKMTSISDPDTGEFEVVEPVQSDGVQRSYSVSNGNLIDDVSGRVLAEKVSAIDPLPGSTQYNQEYSPFQLTTIGSRRALTITLITEKQDLGKPRFFRMNTTVIIRKSL